MYMCYQVVSESSWGLGGGVVIRCIKEMQSPRAHPSDSQTENFLKLLKCF